MQKEYTIIGMMSGTSLDGIDLACCHFTFNEKWKYSLVAAKTYTYTKDILDLILIMQSQSTTFLHFKTAEIAFSQYLAAVIQQFIEDYKLNNIDYVAIHGHTIFHQPKAKITVQAANLSTLAASLNLDIIGNFRQFDVMGGGQGAPLAPYGQDLFQSKICLNFGGICNLGIGTFGWDINYCNLLFNHYAKQVENVQFDRDGDIGRRGIKSQQFHQFLSQHYKNNRSSLGRQGFQRLIEAIDKNFTSLRKQDLMGTFYSFLAQDINANVLSAIGSSRLSSKQPIKVLCTGGGAKNSFLLELLNQQSKDKALYVLPDQQTIDFKEAIIFAYLGLKFIEGIPNCSKGIGGQLIKGRNRHQKDTQNT